MRRIVKKLVRKPRIDSKFKEWLIDELSVRKMKQTDLCIAIGIRPGSLNLYVKGKRNPTPSTINLIADALTIPREELYRAAGFFPPVSLEIGYWERVKYKYFLLTPENRARVDRYLDFELEEQKRGKPQINKAMRV
jgi:transcriptional regulator with XRE-family HTH domain